MRERDTLKNNYNLCIGNGNSKMAIFQEKLKVRINNQWYDLKNEKRFCQQMNGLQKRI